MKKESDNEFRFISMYESHVKIIQKAIKKSWYLLQGDKKYGKLFKKIPQFVYKKGKTIGNFPVKSDIGAKSNVDTRLQLTDKKGTFLCNNCQNCHSIIRGPVITHPMKGQEIPIKSYNTCNSSDVIYMLKCPSCVYWPNQ